MASTAVSNALSAVTPNDETAFTFQTYETELANLRAHLEMVIRVRVLATLIWQYSDVDGRERISFFLDRQLSPSPSFALIYDQSPLSFPHFLKRVPGIEIVTPRSPTSSHRCTIVKLNGQEIVKQSWGIKHDYEPEDLKPVTFCIEKIVSWKALQILRKDEKYFKCLLLQNLPEVRYDIDLSNYFIKAGLSEKQIERVLKSDSNVSLIAYKALSCQENAFDFQFIVQKKTEHVICHLKLNDLPLYEPSNPGRGMTEDEAIDDLLEKSGQYLLGMAKSLTLREFRIIENELLKRYPQQPDILANIIAFAAKQHWVSLF